MDTPNIGYTSPLTTQTPHNFVNGRLHHFKTSKSNTSII